MKTEINETDDALRKAFENFRLDSPDSGFTAKVMNRLPAQSYARAGALSFEWKLAAAVIFANVIFVASIAIFFPIEIHIPYINMDVAAPQSETLRAISRKFLNFFSSSFAASAAGAILLLILFDIFIQKKLRNT